jgi:hypothetical protein
MVTPPRAAARRWVGLFFFCRRPPCDPVVAGRTTRRPGVRPSTASGEGHHSNGHTWRSRLRPPLPERGVNALANAVKVTSSQGRKTSSSTELGSADHHQRRREPSPMRSSWMIPPRTWGPSSAKEVRPRPTTRRRRHHHRSPCSPGHGAGGTAQRHGRRRPVRAQAGVEAAWTRSATGCSSWPREVDARSTSPTWLPSPPRPRYRNLIGRRLRQVGKDGVITVESPRPPPRTGLHRVYAVRQGICLPVLRHRQRSVKEAESSRTLRPWSTITRFRGPRSCFRCRRGCCRPASPVQPWPRTSRAGPVHPRREQDPWHLQPCRVKAPRVSGTA